ncbi:MAG: retroviral-like aspartic protease [Chloroflexi bacterium]|nr:retroviral-like aspartic protease [Chloroflexota bacterium]MCC6895752.1 retroviral-like aspartic protease [Anaerolineae bacterium]
MAEVITFPFIQVSNGRNEFAQRPIIPISLSLGANRISAMALIDSGADVNVLPYDVGLQLGANWNVQKIQLELSGNLSQFEAKGILLSINIGSFDPVKLAFAWTQSRQAPLILGQMNFSDEFAVCFHRFRNKIEIQPRSGI